MYSSQTKYLLKQSGIEIHNRYPTSPISLKIMCTYLNLKYVKMSLSQNTCGSLLRSSEGNFIFINENHSYTRRRFSLAHEIGHYCLGHESDVSKLNDYNRREEIHANRFATSLLMPDELFYYIHKENFSIKAMAQWLRVSMIAVAIRCQEFGIRQFESEMIRSEYYASLEEVAYKYVQKKEAAAEHKADYRTVTLSEAHEQFQSPLPPINPKYNAVMRQNEDTIDRLRRIYGYE